MDSKIVCPKCGTELTLHDMCVLGHIEVDPRRPWYKSFWADSYEYQCPSCGEHIPCGFYGNILEAERKETITSNE